MRNQLLRWLYADYHRSFFLLETKRFLATCGVKVGGGSPIQKGNYVFIHIPKTGGTSIIHALGLDYQHYSHLSFLQIQAAKPLVTVPIQYFSVVRNPWDRLVSTYYYLNQPRFQHPFHAKDPKIIWKANVDCSSFRQFVLSLTSRKIRSQLLLLPQYYFLCDRKGQLAVDMILRQEQLAKDFHQLAEALGLGCLSLPQANRSDRDRSYTAYYDDETQEHVRALYPGDIHLFNYSF